MRFYKIIATFILVSLLAMTGFGCKGPSSLEQEATKPITLEMWGVYDESDIIEDLISSYRSRHSNVKINYKMLRFDEYEDELLNALAEDRGPDIFAVHNHWVNGYVNKIEPLPPSLTIGYIETTGGAVSQKTTVNVQQERSLTLRQLRDGFVDTVYDDAVISVYNEQTEGYEDKIFALPLSVDTLALYYNRDLLNVAGIAQPPADWVTFQEQVKSLTKLDADGNIAQSAAAIGTSSNVERSTDILSILMMQNGTEMTNDAGFATFHKTPSALSGRDEPPGYGALRFYTDFARPNKEVYTWNDNMPSSLDAFATGQTAYFFGYSYHLDQIRAKAPQLNFGVAKLPQLEGNPEVNFANYWMYTVSQKTENLDYAWDFVQFMADSRNVQQYLEAANRPTALRSLQAEQLEDLDLSVFASQILTAQSWYEGKDWEAVENAFDDLIDSQVYGSMEIKDAINLAASRVNQTL